MAWTTYLKWESPEIKESVNEKRNVTMNCIYIAVLSLLLISILGNFSEGTNETETLTNSNDIPKKWNCWQHRLNPIHFKKICQIVTLGHDKQTLSNYLLPDKKDHPSKCIHCILKAIAFDGIVNNNGDDRPTKTHAKNSNAKCLACTLKKDLMMFF